MTWRTDPKRVPGWREGGTRSVALAAFVGVALFGSLVAFLMAWDTGPPMALVSVTVPPWPTQLPYPTERPEATEEPTEDTSPTTIVIPTPLADCPSVSGHICRAALPTIRASTPVPLPIWSAEEATPGQKYVSP